MKLFVTALLLILAWILVVIVAGCAHTEIRDPRTGKVVFRTEADATGLSYSGNGVTFHVDVLRQSEATAQGGTSAAKIIQSAGTAAGAVGAAVATSGVVR
jgi:hypothetical protein